ILKRAEEISLFFYAIKSIYFGASTFIPLTFMNLGIYFSPVDPTLYQDITARNSFGKSIQIYQDNFPDVEAADIAIVGLTENRGAGEDNRGIAQAADTIRKALYRLKKGGGDYKIVDLGNLRNGHDLDETYLRIK